MNVNYTVRLARFDRPDFGAGPPIAGGEYSANLFIVAENAEEACRRAMDHMIKTTGKNDWRIRSLDENCGPICEVTGRY